jgi:hypothetical protein
MSWRHSSDAPLSRPSTLAKDAPFPPQGQPGVRPLLKRKSVNTFDVCYAFLTAAAQQLNRRGQLTPVYLGESD